MRILAVFLACAATLSAQKDSVNAVPQPGPVSAEQRAKLAALFPDPASLAAKASGPYQTYSSDLYKYLDGGADAYLIGGMIAMIHQELKTADIEITADIFDMGDGAHSSRIYSIERPPDCRTVSIGNEGYVDEGLLNFTGGEYYVKLLAFGSSSNTAAALDKLGRAIAARIAAGRAAAQGKK